MKRITHHDHVGLLPAMRAWFDAHKSIGVIHHINKMKEKTEFDKVQYPLPIKTLKIDIEGSYLSTRKAWYENPTTNIIGGGKTKDFSLRSGARQGYTLLPLLFKLILEVLLRAIRQEKEIEGIHIEKEKVMLFLFVNGKIMYVENPKDSTTTKNVRTNK